MDNELDQYVKFMSVSLPFCESVHNEIFLIILFSFNYPLLFLYKIILVQIEAVDVRLIWE